MNQINRYERQRQYQRTARKLAYVALPAMVGAFVPHLWVAGGFYRDAGVFLACALFGTLGYGTTQDARGQVCDRFQITPAAYWSLWTAVTISSLAGLLITWVIR
jgi:hypothetical protein